MVAAELWGGICILGCRFHLVGSSKGGIFQVEMAPGCGCGTRRRHSHLETPFSGSQFLVGKLRGRHFFQV